MAVDGDKIAFAKRMPGTVVSLYVNGLLAWRPVTVVEGPITTVPVPVTVFHKIRNSLPLTHYTTGATVVANIESAAGVKFGS